MTQGRSSFAEPLKSSPCVRGLDSVMSTAAKFAPVVAKLPVHSACAGVVFPLPATVSQPAALPFANGLALEWEWFWQTSRVLDLSAVQGRCHLHRDERCRRCLYPASTNRARGCHRGALGSQRCRHSGQRQLSRSRRRRGVSSCADGDFSDGSTTVINICVDWGFGHNPQAEADII